MAKPIKARKRFGQNFLCDPSVIAQICHSIAPQPTDNMVEIGPGLGAITVELLKHVDQLHVIELDRDLIPQLRVICDGLGKLEIHQADALRFDYSTLAGDKKLRIVGNLPYNISTPLLFHLLKNHELIEDMYFMLQHEVVARMAAQPNTAQYGRLTVMLQYHLEIDPLFSVPPSAFEPQPKVMSAIVRLKPRAKIENPVQDMALFSHLVRDAFNLRRKTIRNSMAKYLVPEDFSSLSIDPKLRAENLSIADFVQIANYLYKKR